MLLSWCTIDTYKNAFFILILYFITCIFLNRDDDFRHVCKQLYGLAYIPEEDVPEVFKLVQASCTTAPQKAVAQHFGETYVERPPKPRRRKPEDARYPPSTWNQYRSLYEGSPHTNNSSEGNNNKLAKLHNKKDSTIWSYIQVMKQEERNAERTITHMTANQVFAEEASEAVSRKVRIRQKLELYTASTKLEVLGAIARLLDE